MVYKNQYSEIQVNLPKDLEILLETTAKNQGQKLYDAICEAVREYIDNHPNSDLPVGRTSEAIYSFGVPESLKKNFNELCIRTHTNGESYLREAMYDKIEEMQKQICDGE